MRLDVWQTAYTQAIYYIFSMPFILVQLFSLFNKGYFSKIRNQKSKGSRKDYYGHKNHVWQGTLMLEKLSKPMAEIERLFDDTTAAFSVGLAIIYPYRVSFTKS